jgi:PAS domain S-box-containing protein
VAWGCALAVIAIGVADIVGTLLNVTLLTSVAPQWTRMKVIAAVCFILSGLQLALLLRRPSNVHKSFLLQSPAILVAAAGILTISLYTFRLVTGHEPVPGSMPFLSLFWNEESRIALLTAIIFVLVACGLVGLARGSRLGANIAHGIISVAAIGSYFVPVSYLLGAEEMHSLLGVPVALNTGIAFCLLCTGIFCSRTDTWVMAVFAAGGVGGYMARRLLPAILVIPVIVACVHEYGVRSGAFGPEVVPALVAVLSTVLLVWFVWLTARSINQPEANGQLAAGLGSERDKSGDGRRPGRFVIKYVYAILAVPLAIGLRYALMPFIGQGVPYISLFVVTTIVAVLGGLGPAVLNGILAAIFTDYFFVEPLYTFDLNPKFLWRTAVVVLTSAFIGYIGDSLRAARARAERQAETLRQSEATLRGILKATKESVWLFSPEGVILMGNEMATSRFGQGGERIIGKHFHEVMPPELAKSRLAVLKKVVESAQPMESEDQRAGMVFHHDWYPIVDEAGSITSVACFSRDITERKRAQEAVTASELRYRRLFEASRDGILILDTDSGRIVDVNPFIEHILGYSHDELLDKSIWDVGTFKNIVASKEAFGELQTKGYVRYENMPLETKDGHQISVEFVSNVYMVDQRKVIQCNIRDITERVKAEESLRLTRDDLVRSNRDLEQFAYVASHDLQEPLRAVAGFVELLRRNLHDSLDARTTSYMDFAVDGAKRMQTLVNGLLEYSRIGTQGEKHEDTDAKAAVETAMAHLRATIQETGAEVTADELPKVNFDAVQLAQLFQNLIGNAIKFRGQETPRIHISAARDGDGWRFAVSDNGIGIEPEYADRIFLIFQRLHDREKYPGTGIGLAICKKIVEHHNGKIWVESKPGAGSTFYFTVPDASRNEHRNR